MTPIKPVSEMTFRADNSMIPVAPAEYAQQLWDRVKELEQELHLVRVEMGMSITERDSLRQQLEEANRNQGYLRSQLDLHKKELNQLAASEAQLRKALKKYQARYHGAEHANKDWQEFEQLLSTPPSKALRPWVEFIKNYTNPVPTTHSELLDMNKEATQLLSSINFPGA